MLLLGGAARPPLPEATVRSHDLTLAEVDGRTVLIAVPVISEDDPPRVREGIARRRLVTLTGECPCGGTLMLVATTGRIAHTAVEHESDCPAIDPYGEGGSS